MKYIRMILMVAAMAAFTVQAAADLQSMIDTAADGATIKVPAGTYDSFSVTNKTSLTLEPQGGAVVVDGHGIGRCAFLGAEGATNVVAKGFIFRNGEADWGGGVYGGLLVDCRIENCNAANGGGVYGATLDNCTVSGCTATESAAATMECIATRCVFKGNARPNSDSPAAMHGGIVQGGIYTSCLFDSNTVEMNDGVAAFGGIAAEATLVGCEVKDNDIAASRDHYGLLFSESSITNEYLAGNSVDAGDPDAMLDTDTASPVPVAVPTAVAGLVYNGKEQIGVVESDWYEVVGGAAVDAGSYTATVKLRQPASTVWEDGGSEDRQIGWTIARGVCDMSGVAFEGQAFVYDGKPHSLAITGQLPAGVTVSYSANNSQTALGKYEITASFAADSRNYEPILSMKAMLVINRNGALQNDLYTDSKAGGAFAGNVTYTGWLRNADGEIAGTVVFKAAKAKNGFSKVTATVTPLGDRKTTSKFELPVNGGTATYQNAVFSADAVTGEIAVNGVSYQLQAGADFFKSKDKSEKTLAKASVPVGTWTFALETSAGVVPCSVTVARNSGKAKLTGYLADGTKLSISAAGVYGEGDGKRFALSYAVPFVYAKKGVKLGFVLWIDLANGSAEVSDFTGFTGAAVEPAALKTPIAGTRVFSVDIWHPERNYTITPEGQTFSIEGARWVFPKKDANPSSLKLKYAAKTGIVTGSFKLGYPNGAKSKFDTATVYGVVVDGAFCGAAKVKRPLQVFSVGF